MGIAYGKGIGEPIPSSPTFFNNLHLALIN
ncbi:hypothetical protein NC653_037486 [Populus alba x Populus x berolinensis]|uniref:Uncharacterized protein n=1 Tax=Populus alba x Populus x berolinensis TaxID=444605 RepID=A0AAD6LEM2_9ROSI|nr:hypothetical protein NC653_037486 [Populus alba x Populus x berolinensis]